MDPAAPIIMPIAINAANEGIPVAAIARIINRPFDVTLEALHEAKDRGSIAELPRPDWPPGTRIHDRLPSIPLPSDQDLAFLCGKTFRLTSLEAGFLVALLKNQQVKKTRLHGIVEHQRNTRMNQPDHKEATDPKMVDVMICKLRKKLKVIDSGLEIKTIWGDGYYVETDMKARIVAHLDGAPHGQKEKAPAPASARITNGNPVARVG